MDTNETEAPTGSDRAASVAAQPGDMMGSAASVVPVSEPPWDIDARVVEAVIVTRAAGVAFEPIDFPGPGP